MTAGPDVQVADPYPRGYTEGMLREVSLEELDAARRGGGRVIDVRESHEYVEGHVPGAELMPLRIVPARVQDLPRSRPVYVICASGGRSAQAADHLRRAGIDARSVAGGTTAWIRSGRPLATGPSRA